MKSKVFLCKLEYEQRLGWTHINVFPALGKLRKEAGNLRPAWGIERPFLCIQTLST